MTVNTAGFNPFGADFSGNPYPAYRRLRETAPVYCIQGCLGNDWVLSRYADIRKMLQEGWCVVDDLPARIRQTASRASAESEVEALCRFLDHWLFFVNPPGHTRLRQAVAAYFSKAAVDLLANRIRTFTKDLIGRSRHAGRIDMVHDLAKPLPGLIAASLLGVPLEDVDRLTAWSVDLFSVFVQPASLSHYRRLNNTTEEFRLYFESLKTAPPYEAGLLERLKAECNAGGLTIDETLAFSMMLFAVGQETTQHLICNGLFALLEHPEEMAMLRARPEIMPAAIKELARYNTPVQMIIRRAVSELQIGGCTIRAGERLHLLLGSAHHDEEVFADPERLDLARTEASGLLFGSGIHLCLGAHLAQLTAGTAVQTVLTHLHDLRLANFRPQWIRSVHMRGLIALPCVFRAGGAQFSVA